MDMETEISVPCVVNCSAATVNGSSSSNSNNNNNIVTKSNFNQQSSNTTNNAIAAASIDQTIGNCDNVGDNAVAVAFAEIHLNNNESTIGFVDDEDEAVGETTIDAANAAENDEGACCKPDVNNCDIDAVAKDGKHISLHR